MMTIRKVGMGFAAVGAVLALIAGMAWSVRKMNQADAADARAQTALFARANRICGTAPPRSIKTHGASWSFGSYLEVRCADGSVRVVQ